MEGKNHAGIALGLGIVLFIQLPFILQSLLFTVLLRSFQYDRTAGNIALVIHTALSLALLGICIWNGVQAMKKENPTAAIIGIILGILGITIFTIVRINLSSLW